MSGKRPIILASYDYQPIVGGMGSYTVDMQEALGDEALIVTARGLPSAHTEILSTARFSSIGPLLFSVVLSIKLQEIVKRHNARVLNVQSGPGGVFLLRDSPVLAVATAHHSYALSIRYKYTTRLAPYYYGMALLEKQSLRRMKAIFAVSEFMKKALVDSFNLDPTRIWVMPIPPAGFFKPISVKKNNSLLFVGRIERQKGILELIEAFRLVRSFDSLTIVGQGSAMADVKRLVGRLGLKKRIEILGYVERSELPKYYSQARLTVMPSRFESLGLVAFESIACGTPCLVGPHTGVASYLDDAQPELVLRSINPRDMALSIERLNLGSVSTEITLPTWDSYMRNYNAVIESITA